MKIILAKSIVTILLLTYSCRQTDNKTLIVGTWTFYQFDFGNTEKNNDTDAKNANGINRGLEMTFTADNTWTSSQLGGSEANNSKGKYYLLPENKVVFMEDTIKILRLDKSFLKLFRGDEFPVAVFKRK